MESRFARHGAWSVWRLLVAAKICRSIESAKSLVASGEVLIEDDLLADELTYVPVGVGSIRVRVRHLEFSIFGIAPGQRFYNDLPHTDTCGMNEPPKFGDDLVIPAPTLKTKSAK